MISKWSKHAVAVTATIEFINQLISIRDSHLRCCTRWRSVKTLVKTGVYKDQLIKIKALVTSLELTIAVFIVAIVRWRGSDMPLHLFGTWKNLYETQWNTRTNLDVSETIISCVIKVRSTWVQRRRMVKSDLSNCLSVGCQREAILWKNLRVRQLSSHDNISGIRLAVLTPLWHCEYYRTCMKCVAQNRMQQNSIVEMTKIGDSCCGYPFT